MATDMSSGEGNKSTVSSAQMDGFSFRTFCQLLNKLERMSGPKRKNDAIFTREFRAVQSKESVFPLPPPTAPID